MSLIYGSQYSEAAISFKVLIWLISFTLISGHYMYTLFAYDKQWYEFFTAICSAVISILLNLFLILRYGFLGAAFALICTEAVVWFMNYYFVRREIANIPFLGHLIRPLIAGTVMTAVILIMPHFNFLVVGSTAVIIYGLGMLILQPGIIKDVSLLVVGDKQEPQFQRSEENI